MKLIGTGGLFIHGDPIITEREEKVMKKRAISFILCLMMVVTLFGNGIPVYAANELEQPIVATEETSQDALEASEEEDSPDMEASEAEPTDATDAGEMSAVEAETEVKPSEAADTEERETVNKPETTEEAVGVTVFTPSEATLQGAPQMAEDPFLKTNQAPPMPMKHILIWQERRMRSMAGKYSRFTIRSPFLATKRYWMREHIP